MADNKEYDQKWYANEGKRYEIDRPKAPRSTFPREYEAPVTGTDAPNQGPVTILRGGKSPETVQGFSKGGMVRKHGSPTDCGPMCRDSKTIRR